MADRIFVNQNDPNDFVSQSEVIAEYGKDPRVKGMNPDQIGDWYVKTAADKQGIRYAEKPSVMARAAKNFFPSAGRLLSGVWDTVTSPVKNANAVAALVTGDDFAYKPGTKEQLVFSGPQMREGFMNLLKQRYGGVDNIKETFADDPVGILSDASTVFVPALGGASKAASAAGMARTAAAIGRVGEAARYLDAPTAIVGAAVKGTGKVLPKAAERAHNALFESAPGMTADEIRAGRRRAWIEGIGAGRKGEAKAGGTLGANSQLRRAGAESLVADPTKSATDKTIEIGDIVNPNPGLMQTHINPATGQSYLKPMDTLWDDARTMPGSEMDIHRGQFDAVNKFISARTGGTHVLNPDNAPHLNEIGGYANPPSPGVFEPHAAAIPGEKDVIPSNPPSISVDEVNLLREGVNKNEKMFQRAAHGEHASATKATIAEEAATKRLMDNARTLLYSKLESAGITPPTVNGKAMTWKEFGARDREISDAMKMAQATIEKAERSPHFMPGGVGPYYTSMTIGAGAGLLKGDPQLGAMVAAATLIGIAMAKRAPDKSSQILQWIGKQHLTPQQWRMVGDAVRGGVTAPSASMDRFQRFIEDKSAQPGAAAQQTSQNTEEHPF